MEKSSGERFKFRFGEESGRLDDMKVMNEKRDEREIERLRIPGR